MLSIDSLEHEEPDSMKHEKSGEEDYGNLDERVKLGSVSRVFQIEKDLDDAW